MKKVAIYSILLLPFIAAFIYINCKETKPVKPKPPVVAEIPTNNLSYMIDKDSIFILDGDKPYFFPSSFLTTDPNCDIDLRKAAPSLIEKINQTPVMNVDKEVKQFLSAFYHEQLQDCLDKLIGDKEITLD